jgi:hypothetical protein
MFARRLLVNNEDKIVGLAISALRRLGTSSLRPGTVNEKTVRDYIAEQGKKEEDEDKTLKLDAGHLAGTFGTPELLTADAGSS